jgi:hypothetical protein
MSAIFPKRCSVFIEFFSRESNGFSASPAGPAL